MQSVLLTRKKYSKFKKILSLKVCTCLYSHFTFVFISIQLQGLPIRKCHRCVMAPSFEAKDECACGCRGPRMLKSYAISSDSTKCMGDNVRAPPNVIPPNGVNAQPCNFLTGENQSASAIYSRVQKMYSMECMPQHRRPSIAFLGGMKMR